MLRTSNSCTMVIRLASSYGLLTNDTMTGAQFSLPEVMAFYTADKTASGRDEAVLNIKYLDAGGNPGNIITVARNIANTSTADRPTNWWLVGNQQPVDITAKVIVRRIEQLNPNSSNNSRFQSGIQFIINAKGPGSVTADGNLAYARVTGAGLPAAGLVYIAPVDAEVGQTYMDVSNKLGDITNLTRCGNSPSTTTPSYNCPNFWFGRTAGTAGSAATTFANNLGGVLWAQNSDNLNSTFPGKGQRYQVELFYGTKTTPTYTYNKTLLSDLVVATQAVNLPWRRNRH
ncbi:hypothetical protein RA280_43290 [Cupriavidus sp. CV2]|uniref:hypothetical protein n=1 Tax=Cupriavidus ulmosensis TaxID=3065913 RepID=UPI00296AE79B|nr:hypothetical protein [Cupriavidus sp. CV2]MDW3688441.1 hypothetical protein [Cupriavidus sp. CV2]